MFMTKIGIGYVQGVHGLRGDLKIKNRFENPNRVFQKGNTIYLNEEAHQITNCKFYKGFYLVTIDNLKDINLVEKYKGFDVFFERDDLHLKEGEYLLEDLIGFEIREKEFRGTVKALLHNGIYPLLKVEYEKDYLIPFVDDYIVKVDVSSKCIQCKDIEGLLL